MASITAHREDQPCSMPGKGTGKEAGQVGFVAVVLLALLLPSPSLLACPLPPVTRCSLHKATILEHAGIKWKWKRSRSLESSRVTCSPLNGELLIPMTDGIKRVFTMYAPQHRTKTAL